MRIIHSGVGNVSESDVKVAHAAHAAIVAFSTGVDPIARDSAERDAIPVLSFSIIYEMADALTALLTERIPAIEVEKEIGRARVLKLFSSSGRKHVVGAHLELGTLSDAAKIKIVRKGESLGHGNITNLQQARANISTVKEGDFGAEIEARVTLAPGDELVSFTLTRV